MPDETSLTPAVAPADASPSGAPAAVAVPKEKSPVAALPKLSAKEAGKKAQALLESSPEGDTNGAAVPAKAPPDPAKDEKSSDRDTQKARELVKAGDLQGAMKVIGLDPTKLGGESWTRWKRYADNVAARVLDVQRTAEAKEQEVRAIAERLVKEHEGYAAARNHYEAGDYEEAFRAAFGEELHEFQKKAFTKLANPGVGKDPAVVAAMKKIDALEARLAEKERTALEQDNVRSIEQKRAEYRKGLTQELAALDDQAIAAGAEDPEFVAEVFEEQRKAYDKDTDQTLSAQEAAEKVIERYRAMAERAKRFSGQSEAQTDTSKPSQTGNTIGKSAPGPAKPTSLSAKEASEATTTSKLKGRDLIDYHVRRATQA